MAEILRDDQGKPIPQYQKPDGTYAPLVGEAAPYAEIVDKTGAALFTEGNPGVTKVTGSNMEYYGNVLADAPDPTTVPIGAEYTAIEEEEIIYINNGTTWKEWLVL